MLNRWDGIGNLGKDPETRYSTGVNQTAICRFSIAVDKGYGENKKTVWVNIVTLGKLAENCQKFLSKGKKVYVSGELDIREYNKQDGSRGYITEVTAKTVEFLSTQEQSGYYQQGFGQQQVQHGFGQQQMQPAWTQGFASDQQAISYQQYQEQKKYEEAMQQPRQIDAPEGFASLRDDDIPF